MGITVRKEIKSFFFLKTWFVPRVVARIHFDKKAEAPTHDKYTSARYYVKKNILWRSFTASRWYSSTLNSTLVPEKLATIAIETSLAFNRVLVCTANVHKLIECRVSRIPGVCEKWWKVVCGKYIPLSVEVKPRLLQTSIGSAQQCRMP